MWWIGLFIDYKSKWCDQIGEPVLLVRLRANTCFHMFRKDYQTFAKLCVMNKIAIWSSRDPYRNQATRVDNEVSSKKCMSFITIYWLWKNRINMWNNQCYEYVIVFFDLSNNESIYNAAFTTCAVFSVNLKTYGDSFLYCQ